MNPINTQIIPQLDLDQNIQAIDSQSFVKNIGNYSDTFNILLGTTNKTIDLLNNPYVKYTVYEMDSSR